MLSKIATTLSLAILTSTSFAVLADSTSARIDAARADGTGDVEISEKFQQLDRNGDGLLSRSEAEADYAIGNLYDSFDTSATIEKGSENSAEGITEEQFEAGMQALAKGSGAIGPAVSGGETILIYPDGTMERVKGTGVQLQN